MGESKTKRENQNKKLKSSTATKGNQDKGADSASVKNLASAIKSKFNEESKVVELNLNYLGEPITVFYIESLIDKKMLMNNFLSKFQELNNFSASSGVQNQSADSENNEETQSFVEENGSKNESKQVKNNQKSDKKEPKNDLKSAKNDSKSDKNDQKNEQKSINFSQKSGSEILAMLKSQIATISLAEEYSDEFETIDKILAGNVALVCKESSYCISIFGAKSRSISEPPNSRVVKGPREGFVEDIFTNIGLVRKRLRSRTLRQVDLFVGERTKTQVTLIYLEDIAKPEIVEQVKKKIEAINIDGIIDSYYIESFLEEDKLKFFRRVGNTEKPDIFSAKVLEGRVGILVEGSPVALTLPFVLFEDLQSAEDYYTFPTMASFVRMMRIAGLIFAILIPAVYVALQSYNYEILPINFLITLLSSIEGLSIPPLMEILVVLLLFEVITEASIRMPNSLGMALSIIGALALGNTAVDAGIISPPSIVTVAVSSVALYIIPDQIAQTRILRVLFTVIGGIIGLYGVVVSFIILTTYLCSIDSFGIPYMAPLAPSIKADKKDAFIKSSIEEMKTRPELIASQDKIRQGGEKNDG